jgi:acetyl-CoA carboxylase carboxyltransferase component
MGVVEDKMEELKSREAKTLEMGGEKAVARQHEKNKLTARERLNRLFDAGTFREIDMFVNHRCVNFGMETVDIPADGVVTGHGLVDGRRQMGSSPATAWSTAGRCLLFPRILRPEPAAWGRCILKKFAK